MTATAKVETLRHIRRAEVYLLMLADAAKRGDEAEVVLCRRAAEVSIERATGWAKALGGQG